LPHLQKVFGRFGGLAVSRYVLDNDHIPAEPSEEPVRGLSRGLVVGDYEGLRAGEAIAAVRVLGLRPCLERVEGYEAGLHGFVVSQEPSDGAEVSPDSQVFLYVASPARTVVSSAPQEDAEAVEVLDQATDDADAQGRTGMDDGDVGSNDGADEATGFDEGAEDVVEDAFASDVDHWDGDDDGDDADGFGESEAFPGEDTRELDAAGREFAEEADGAEDLEGFADGLVEPVRVWRGGLPGAPPHRRLSWWRSARLGVWRRRRRLPLSVQLAVIALFVFAALVVLVSLASGGDSPPRGARRPRPSLSDSRSGARTPVVPAPVVPAPTAGEQPAVTGARPVVSPSLSSGRVDRQRTRRVAIQERTAIPSQPPTAPTPASVSPTAPAPAPSGEAATGTEEHAIREFGP
jgi:hypothetical protein